MTPLTHEENNFYEEQEPYHIYAKKSFAQIKMIKVI